MTTLTVWRFADVDGALRAEREVAMLSALDRLPINDAWLILWPKTAPSPHTRGAGNIAQLAPLDQSFWGLLHGHVFAAPLLAGDGPESHYLQEVGVDAQLIHLLRAGLRQGSSALLTITDQDVPTELAAQIAGARHHQDRDHYRDRIFHRRLTAEHAGNLRRVFGR
ncbi:DUF1269 domain-containing protein [Nakamurella lactea]|uniref:DUF1269 domain-containing protein n=1 Tax=Nakamurella lactea TaxID=459515 RepID=UPI0003FC8C4F|nr:DUF1269 domain-containing protein [Nakamurella lactea]